MDEYTSRLEAAVRAAQAVLARHVVPEGISERSAIDQLLGILDDHELVEAMDRRGTWLFSAWSTARAPWSALPSSMP